MAQNDCCGFKYYDQAGIDADPEKKKTDTFVRFLLCNQKSIQGLSLILLYISNLSGCVIFRCESQKIRIFLGLLI